MILPSGRFIHSLTEDETSKIWVHYGAGHIPLQFMAHNNDTSVLRIRELTDLHGPNATML